MSAVPNTLLPHRIDPATLASLPRATGVYLFHGEGTLPLYIGKSVDIRARVQAHLRCAEEAAMLAQARRVEFIETAGEIGALLLEARLIKEMSPLFNIRLRRLSNPCTLQLEPHGVGLRPAFIHGNTIPIGQVEGLYGLFSSVHAAKERLRELASEHTLCLATLGLEAAGPRGCFGLQLKSCRGACVGREDRRAHDARLLQALEALKVHAWPHGGTIDLVERRGDWEQRHRVLHWRHLGTWCSRTRNLSGAPQERFDLDTYKILVKPVLLGTAVIEPPPSLHDQVLSHLAI